MAYLGNSPQQKFTQKYFYTATAGQTLFSGVDNNGLTLRYEDGKYVDVYLNGSKLQLTEDYTATTKTSITLASGAQAGDILEVNVQGIFTVADTVSASVGGTFGAGITVNGTVTATDFNSVSDATLKENINSITDSHSILSQINPVSFHWKKDGSKSYGVLAQEIEKVLPEIVNTNGSGIKSVSYIQLIALLIDAVNNLQTEVRELKSTTKALPSNPQEVEDGSKVSLHKSPKKGKSNSPNSR